MQREKRFIAALLVLTLVLAGVLGLTKTFTIKGVSAATVTVSGRVVWVDAATTTPPAPVNDRPSQSVWANTYLVLYSDGVPYPAAGVPTVTTVNVTTWSFSWSGLDSDHYWTVGEGNVPYYNEWVSGNSSNGYSIYNVATRSLEIGYWQTPQGDNTYFVYGTASATAYTNALHHIYLGTNGQDMSQVVFCVESRNLPPYADSDHDLNYAAVDPYDYYSTAPYNLSEADIDELLTGLLAIMQHGFPNMDETGTPGTPLAYHGYSPANEPARYATATAIRWWMRYKLGYSPGSYYTTPDFNALDDIESNPLNLRARTTSLVPPRTAAQNQALFAWTQWLYGEAKAQNVLQHAVTLTPSGMTLVRDSVNGDYYEGTIDVTLTNCNGGYAVTDASIAAITALGGTIRPSFGVGNGSITITFPRNMIYLGTSISIEIVGMDSRAAANFSLFRATRATANPFQTVAHFLVTPSIAAQANTTLDFPDYVSVSGTKVWEGEDGDTSLRPAIEDWAEYLQLYKDGEPYNEVSPTICAVDENTWSFVWNDLDPDAVWTVQESAVPGYGEVHIEGGAENGFTVINVKDSPTPEPTPQITPEITPQITPEITPAPTPEPKDEETPAPTTTPDQSRPTDTPTATPYDEHDARTGESDFIWRTLALLCIAVCGLVLVKRPKRREQQQQ